MRNELGYSITSFCLPFFAHRPSGWALFSNFEPLYNTDVNKNAEDEAAVAAIHDSKEKKRSKSELAEDGGRRGEVDKNANAGVVESNKWCKTKCERFVSKLPVMDLLVRRRSTSMSLIIWVECVCVSAHVSAIYPIPISHGLHELYAIVL